VESLKYVEEKEHEGLARFSDGTLLKMKNVVSPPKDALRVAKKKRIAPFFLTASTNIASLAALAKKEREEEFEIGAGVIPSTAFVMQLMEDHESGDYEKSLKELFEMGPEQIRCEISSLRKPEDCDERLLLMEMLEFGLKKRTNFELVQGVMHVFLMEYGVKILEDRILREKLEVLRGQQKEAIEFLEEDYSFSMHLIDVLNKVQ
jgi:hypothetical protein